MVMEYITSRNLIQLIYETMRVMNKPAAHHAMRVSYIMAKLLDRKKVYDKYEIADLMILGMLHDIGAYKTDDIRKQLTYEAKKTLPHSVYGYLFLKYLSPFGEQSKMILYHHMDYSALEDVEFRYKFELEALKIAEMADIWNKAFGDTFNCEMIEKYSGTKFDPDIVDMFRRLCDDEGLLDKLRDGSYKDELEEYLSCALLSDTEKDQYLKMLMYFTGLKNESMVSETIATISMCRELGKKLGLNEHEKNEVYYAALLHDIGMLAIPDQFINAPRNLEAEEKNLIKTHVGIMEQMLEGKISQSIIKIACAHHERFDGSGYPKGLKAVSMTPRDAILQISEYVVNAMEDKPYRNAFTRDEIVESLKNGMIEGRYEPAVTETLLVNYDDIVELAQDKADIALVTYQKLLRNYKQVYNSLS